MYRHRTAILRGIFFDQDRFAREEKQRFELGHRDVPVVPVVPKEP